MRTFLSVHKGDARPGTLVYLSIRELEAIAAEFGPNVQEAPWGRELELTDPGRQSVSDRSGYRTDPPYPPGANHLLTDLPLARAGPRCLS